MPPPAPTFWGKVDENQVCFLLFFLYGPSLARQNREIVLASAFSHVDQYTDLYEVWPSSTEITRKLQGVMSIPCGRQEHAAQEAS